MLKNSREKCAYTTNFRGLGTPSRGLVLDAWVAGLDPDNPCCGTVGCRAKAAGGVTQPVNGLGREAARLAPAPPSKRMRGGTRGKEKKRR